MLEVYDRVIPRRSLPTLVFAVLDIIRSRVSRGSLSIRE